MFNLYATLSWFKVETKFNVGVGMRAGGGVDIFWETEVTSQVRYDY